MSKKVYKTIETESKLFGLPMIELGLLVLSFVLFMVFTSALGGFKIHLSKWVYVAFFLCEVAAYLFLRWANKNKQPGFLLSAISHLFIQPKQITIQCPSLRRKIGKVQ